MLAAFLEEPSVDRCLSLRRVLCSGEALPPALADRCAARLSARLDNLYGPTEAAIDVTAWTAVAGAAVVPIGAPIDNVRVHVLDARLSPVPIGVPGELYIAGVQVGRGYLGRPDLTAERFVPDPFGPSLGARLYRTGDVARWLASGVVEYLGRADFQVKLRGFRIELGEIEAALGRHPAVRAAVVVVREDRPGHPRLVAYLIGAGGELPGAGQLRSFLLEQLPEHMVPASFVSLEALPLTASGKIDRRALPAPDEGPRAGAAGDLAPPRTPAEEQLAVIWADVLRIERPSVHANFFELGGDSILGIQIVARAREAGLGITPRQIFQHQTIAELAEVAGALGSIDAEQGAVTGPVPLTPIQRWWLDQDVVESHHHNQAFLLEVREALHPSALAAALVALVEHHDLLRLRLAREGGGLRAWIAPPGHGALPPLSEVDVSSVAGAAQAAAIVEASASAQASLDLAAGPILRAVLFDLGAGRQRLLLAVHHLVVDGVSWRILIEDLWTAHRQARRGELIALPAKTTSFRRWAEKLEGHARSEAARGEEPFWLAEARRDAGRLPGRGGEGLEGATRAVAVELDPRETEQLLRDVPAAYRTQINDVLLTALAEAMAPWVGSRRVVVHLEGHGREEIFADADVTRTVGWFTTLFPVVLDLGPDTGPGAALTRVKEQLRAIPGRGLGYGLLRWLRADEIVGKRLAEMPRAEVSFNYLGQLDQVFAGSPFAIAPESPGPAYSPRARRAHALDVQASVRGGRLRLRFAFAEGRFPEEAVGALGERTLERLRALIAHCVSPEAGGYTPSDFTKADLDQEELGDVLDQLGDEE